mgnify:CR=1 FL=1
MVLLDVPYHRQRSAIGCFPAGIKMVLGYFGDKVNERILVRQGRILDYEGTWDAKLAIPVIKRGYHFDSYWEGRVENDTTISARVKAAYLRAMKSAKRIGWRYRGKGSIALAKRFLQKEIPVLAEVEAAPFYKNRSYEFTHIIVLIGFDRSHFFYLDPWRPGKQRKITYNSFQKCWKLHAVYYNSMTVIYPKSQR